MAQVDNEFENELDIENRIQPLFPLWIEILFVGVIFSLGVLGFIYSVIDVLNWK